MKVIINNEIFEYENTVSSIDGMLDFIENKLIKSNETLSHLIIDGEEVYSELYTYLHKNVHSIKTVEVVIQNVERMVFDTLISTNDYLANAVLQLKPLAESFYQLSSLRSWNDLADFFEGISWILDSASRIDKIRNLDKIIKYYEAWNEYFSMISGLSSFMPELENALIAKDQVLIGDLILYEVLPIIEKAQIILMQVIEKGDDRFVG